MGFYSIVDNRAWNSLMIVTEEFKRYSTIKKRENNRIDLDAKEHGILSIYTSYKVMNKWMGRVYHFKWNCVIEDRKPDSDHSIQLRYGGNLFGKREPQFHSKTNVALSKLLNQDKELMEICTTIDFEKLELKYSKKDNTWDIEFWPNYGDFIWILIPPVRYFRKPNSEEITKTIRFIQKMSSLIKKGEFL